jgi:hypothetical protein
MLGNGGRNYYNFIKIFQNELTKAQKKKEKNRKKNIPIFHFFKTLLKRGFE